MIPQKIHISWKNKNLLESSHPLITNGIKKLVELNPDWELEISDDDDVNYYLQENTKGRDFRIIKDLHIVQKTDLWRLFKIYNEGGLYVDIDRFCNVKLFDILEPNTKWVLPTCLDFDFSQDFIFSESNNPAFDKVISLFLERIKTDLKNNIYYLGAQTYMHGITMSLVGKMIDTNPGIEVMNDLRKLICDTDFIKTYREQPPNDTIIYKNENDLDWEFLKRDFYGSNNIRHWTDEW
jgi:hypothetical protein